MKNKIIFTLYTKYINRNKRAVILFTRNRNLKRLKEPTLLNKTIQLDNVTNKAYRAFWMCRSMFGKTWALRPLVVYEIHTTVVIPIIAFAARVW
jgi:hypothetical protein